MHVFGIPGSPGDVRGIVVWVHPLASPKCMYSEWVAGLPLFLRSRLGGPASNLAQSLTALGEAGPPWLGKGVTVWALLPRESTINMPNVAQVNPMEKGLRCLPFWSASVAPIR